MQPFKNKSKYSPYPGFYDLRVFNLNPKEFSAAWRVQDFYTGNRWNGSITNALHRLNGNGWKTLRHSFNDPAAQAEAGRRAPITINLKSERTWIYEQNGKLYRRTG